MLHPISALLIWDDIPDFDGKERCYDNPSYFYWDVSNYELATQCAMWRSQDTGIPYIAVFKEEGPLHPNRWTAVPLPTSIHVNKLFAEFAGMFNPTS